MKHTTTVDTRKPAKPYADFPLFPHATGRWAKKIRGKLVYFGPWSDPQAALDLYLKRKDDLHAGRTPRPDKDEQTIRHLCNAFLTAKQRMVQSGELTTRTFSDYFATCDVLLSAVGKNRLAADLTPDDFGRLRAKLAKSRGPVALGNTIHRMRSVFKFAFENGLIEKPVVFGSEFRKPSRKTIRKARHANGAKLYTPAEIRKLLDIASAPMKAAILLAVNAGFGNSDIAQLPKSALDLDAGFINFPRPKTGIPRRAPLWAETVKAIRAALAVRPKAADKANDELAFITRFGHPFVRAREQTRHKCVGCKAVFNCEPAKPGDAPARQRCPMCNTLQPAKRNTAVVTDALGHEFDKLLAAAQIDPAGRRFYTLRHCFRTVADEVADRDAIDRVMGHENANDMRVSYVERIDDARLRAVTNHVRNWMFGKVKSTKVGR